MMRKFLKTALAVLPLAILASCAADDPIIETTDGNGDVVEKSETRYLKVALSNPEDTPDTRINMDHYYDPGDAQESKIRTMDFFFYDADQKYHSHVNMPIDNNQGLNLTPYLSSQMTGYIYVNVGVKLVQGEKMPAYVTCLINSAEPAATYEGMSLKEVQKHKLSKVTIPASYNIVPYFFSMSNTVYFDYNAAIPGKTTPVFATPISPEKLKTAGEIERLAQDTESQEAKDATVNIYVERNCAKVNFRLTEEAIKEFTSSNGVTLKFVPQKWDINAYEKEYYLYKSYRTGNDDFYNYGTEDYWDDILFPDWNRQPHHRSYWGCSPGYFAKNFPLVADDIKDENEYPYSTYYLTYASASEDATFAKHGTNKYVVESTLPGNRLTGEGMPDQYMPISSIPSVLLTGYYTINDERKTFYTYLKGSDGKPVVYSENEGDIANAESLMKAMLNSQNVVFKMQGGDYIPVRFGDMNDSFSIMHPTKGVRSNGSIKIGGDMVTLQCKPEITDCYYFDPNTGNFVLITNENFEKVNFNLIQNLGCAHAYIDGKTFFSAPIQHWGWHRDDNPNMNKPYSEWNWKEMKTGDFGILRNHHYIIIISNISGIGTGIISEDDPLLPPAEKVDYSLLCRVSVMKWSAMPPQEWSW